MILLESCREGRKKGMFEFFIALFGGLFYTGKILSDKSKINKAEHDFNERAELDKAIRKEVEAPAEVVASIKKKVYRTTFAELREELKDDLKFVYGENTKLYAKVYRTIGHTICCCLIWAKQIGTHLRSGFSSEEKRQYLTILNSANV